MYRLSNVTLPVICAAVLLWSGTQIAQAHPFLIGANPAPETVLPSALAEIQLLFSENLNGDASHIVVWNRDHHNVDNGTASLVTGRPRELDVKLSPLAPGSYHSHPNAARETQSQADQSPVAQRRLARSPGIRSGTWPYAF
jgi:methionine-rich copper-binding protein CopC